MTPFPDKIVDAVGDVLERREQRRRLQQHKRGCLVFSALCVLFSLTAGWFDHWTMVVCNFFFTIIFSVLWCLCQELDQIIYRECRMPPADIANHLRAEYWRREPRQDVAVSQGSLVEFPRLSLPGEEEE
jgi:hypothetical protein